MNPIEHKIEPPVCACGKVMTMQNWQTLALGGGLRDQRGFACNTDGCEGNFPQRWKKMIEEGVMEDDLIRICDCGNEVKVTKPTPESIAWDCPICGGSFMEADV